MRCLGGWVMTVSDEGLRLIRRYEGCRLTAYRCAAGVWTIGWGHTGYVDGKKVTKGMRITQRKADSLLKQDVSRFEKAVRDKSIVPIPLNQHQYDALVSFAFNAGEGNLKKLCRKPRTAGQIAAKLLQYDHAGGVVNAGLRARRIAEHELFTRTLSDCCPYCLPTRTVTSIANAKAEGCSSFVCRGEQVKWVQWELNRVMSAGLKVDGVCGEKTVAAIRRFQAEKHLTVDGLCGKNTRSALKE